MLDSKSIELERKGFGGIRIARELSEMHSLKVCPGTINHWIYGDRKPRLRNIFNRLPSPALSYIIGANKGDGCTITSSGCVKLEVTDRDFAEAFNTRMAQLFARAKPNKIIVRRFEVDRLPLFIGKYASQQLVKLLRLPTKDLLKFAFAYPREFLRGFFDAEESVDVSAKSLFRFQVGVDNSNEGLLKGIGGVLRTQFNINSVIDRKRGTRSPKIIRGKSFVTN